METRSNPQSAGPATATPAPVPSTPSMGQGRGTDLRPAHSGATVAPEARPTYAGADAGSAGRSDKADGACDKTMKNAGDAACDKSSQSGPIGLADDAPAGGEKDNAPPVVTVPAKAGNAAVAGA